MSSFIKRGLSAVLVGASLVAASMSAQATGLPLTLPTAAIDANTTFNFSTDASEMMSALGVNVSALGNTKAVAGGGLAFDMPVTEVSVAVGLLPPSLTPVSGEAMGSALGFQRKGSDGFVLANFGLDFKRSVLQADFITSSGTTKSMDIFSFHVEQGLTISMNGGLSLNMSLDDMALTSSAQDRFASALKLPSYAVAAMGMLNFGGLDVEINPALRKAVSEKAFTASLASTTAVPEAPQALMMMLGLVGLAGISHRRRRD